ncbi:MAG: transporter substrate-binding domain-containing protein [Chitinispirillaceae bacterium]|nr:transporter substrate-binding domain-containing protein [Chitinispirillaceae bacterium]
MLLIYCGRAETRTVRIGVYDNPPKVHLSNTGKPCGIFIDIIENIAEHEGWDIEYVFGTWDEGLARLENGSVDLMPDVAFSEDRHQRFDFNQLAVLSSWLQAYCRKGTSIVSLADFNGKTVAILKGSIQQRICIDIREKLHLDFKLLECPDYDETVKAVESGAADMVVVGRFYAYGRQSSGVVPTSVLLNPSTLHYASPKGRNKDLLSAIDKHLAAILNDGNSIYYQSMVTWLHQKPRFFIPRYVIWAMAGITVFFLVFFILSMILRRQVRKRTEQLREKNRQLLETLQELKKAQDEAIKNERLYALGRLSSGIAHDFNNLLCPIIGSVDLLLSDPGELKDVKTLCRNLEIINAAAQHGKGIVNKMRHFSRSVPHPEVNDRIDINSVIHEVIELTKTRLNEASVKVVLDLGKSCDITGRKSDMHEMLLNLVLNAADAMAGGGRLEISTHNGDRNVNIMVKDSGTGMTEEVRERCFNPFFTTKGEEGTGMGLAMVSNIVAEHGGKIDVESAKGTGTVFIITFSRSSQNKEGNNGGIH